jgi:hypothetical protein
MDGQGRILVDTNRFVLREVASILADAGNTSDTYVSVPPPDATNVIISNTDRYDDPLIDAEYTGGQVRYRYNSGGSPNARLSVLAF